MSVKYELKPFLDLLVEILCLRDLAVAVFANRLHVENPNSDLTATANRLTLKN